jgi:GT2 family glycosyltransferase
VTDLSIVLLTWNGRDLALDCLASIEREIRARSDAGRLDTETVVVDNGSADGSVEAIRARFPWAEVVALPRNIGFAGGNNAGLARAKGRMVCLLNNDTIVQRDGFEACVRYLDAHPDVGAVGPQLRHPDGRKQNSIHNFPTLLLEIVPRGVLETIAPRRYPSKRFAHEQPLEVEAVLGACLFVRREVIQQVGLIDEDYFFFLEETDWCHRMRAAGWRVFHLPQATVIHLYGESTKKKLPLRTRIEYYRSRYIFFRKNRSPAVYKALRAIVMIKILFGTVFGGRRASEYRKILAWHNAGEPATSGLAAA